MKTKGIFAVLLGAGFVTCLGVQNAAASSATLGTCFSITTNACTSATGPYGTISWTSSGDSLTATVTLDPNFYFTDSTGSGKAIYFDLLTADNIPASDITVNTAGFVLDGASGPGGDITNTFDAGTGAFEYAIECGDGLTGNKPCPGGADGSTSDATTFSFTITDPSITTLGNPFVSNTAGYYFASSVFSPLGDNGSGGTFEAAASSVVSTTSAVPEPTTLTLLGLGFAGLAAAGARRRAKESRR